MALFFPVPFFAILTISQLCYLCDSFWLDKIFICTEFAKILWLCCMCHAQYLWWCHRHLWAQSNLGPPSFYWKWAFIHSWKFYCTFDGMSFPSNLWQGSIFQHCTPSMWIAPTKENVLQTAYACMHMLTVATISLVSVTSWQTTFVACVWVTCGGTPVIHYVQFQHHQNKF